MKKNLILSVVLLLGILVNSQIKVNNTIVNETCIGNGSIKIDVSNTQNGASLQYILRDPSNPSGPPIAGPFNQTASSSTDSYTFNSLVAGNYIVRVVEDFNGSQSNSQQTVTVGSDYQNLNVSFSTTTVCGVSGDYKGDYQVTINTLANSFTSYDIYDSNDVLVVDDGTSNTVILENTGAYEVVFTDSCGQLSTFNLNLNSDLEYRIGLYRVGQALSNCNTLNYFINTKGSRLPYPIDVELTITNSDNTNTETFTFNGINNVSELNNIQQDFIYYGAGVTHTISTVITDSCGNEHPPYISNINYDADNIILERPDSSCGGKYFGLLDLKNVSLDTNIKFTQYPVGFEPWQYNAAFNIGEYSHDFTSTELNGYGEWRMSTTFGDIETPLPMGDYEIIVSDACGNSKTFNVNIPPSDLVIRNSVYNSCDDTMGIYLFVTNSGGRNKIADFTSLTMTQAPQEYFDANPGATLPINFDHAIITQTDSYSGVNYYAGYAFIANLPRSTTGGSYKFEGNTDCNTELVESSNINTTQEIDIKTEVTYTKLCSEFSVKLALKEYGTSSTSIYYYLQKYNETEDDWGHPTTGVLQGNNDVGSANGFLMGRKNVTLTFRLASGYTEGKYRIMAMSHKKIEDGNITSIDDGFEQCQYPLETFDIYYRPELEEYYVFQCTDGNVNIVLDAKGVGNLTYEIIEQDGSSYIVDNGEEPVFVNLQPGVYLIKITDDCGEIVVSVDANDTKYPVIRGDNLCDGENGFLYLPGLDFLDIEWTKGTDPTVIATGNYLNFTPFNEATNIDEYHANLSYSPNPESCISEVISIDLNSIILDTPNAGTGQTATVINQNINLFDYLTGSYDSHGYWQEVTNSNLLLANGDWLGSAASSGTYEFEYVVEALCGTSIDTATVIINLVGDCNQPPTLTGSTLPSVIGISTLDMSNNGKELLNGINGAYIALESKSKGFVITRTTSSSIDNPVEGMLIWDTGNNCLKLHNGNVWRCIEKDCNE